MFFPTTFVPHVIFSSSWPKMLFGSHAREMGISINVSLEGVYMPVVIHSCNCKCVCVHVHVCVYVICMCMCNVK